MLYEVITRPGQAARLVRGQGQADRRGAAVDAAEDAAQQVGAVGQVAAADPVAGSFNVQRR